MRDRWIALTLVLGLSTAGCGLFGGGQRSEVSFIGDRIEIDGVANEPTGDKVVAGRFATPAGEFTVWTYPSKVGPCYDLVYPNGERTAGCLAASGVDPRKPVTGHDGPGSVRGINPAGFNYGLATGADIGMVHHGVAHPTVAEIRVVATDGTWPEPMTFTPVAAPNVDRFRVFVAYAPAGTKEYRLEAYDADGCLLGSLPTSVSGAASEEPGRDETTGC